MPSVLQRGCSSHATRSMSVIGWLPPFNAVSDAFHPLLHPVGFFLQMAVHVRDASAPFVRINRLFHYSSYHLPCQMSTVFGIFCLFQAIGTQKGSLRSGGSPGRPLQRSVTTISWVPGGKWSPHAHWPDHAHTSYTPGRQSDRRSAACWSPSRCHPHGRNDP